jgi:hypothetical protein
MEHRIMHGKNVLKGAFLICAFLLLISPADGTAREEGGVKAGRADNACLDCHRTLAGKPSEAVVDWEKSVHARAGVRCSWCHGGDPTSADKKMAKRKNSGYIGIPAARNIPALCGKSGCHDAPFSQFIKSSHYDSVMRKGQPGCTNCHGYHSVISSTINAINEKNCTACHSAAFSRGILDGLRVSGKKIEELEGNLSFLKTKSVDISPLSSSLARIKNLHLQVVHVMSRNEIDYTQRIIGLELGSLGTDVGLKLDANRRLDFIYLFTVLFVLVITIVFGIYIVWILSRRND